MKNFDYGDILVENNTTIKKNSIAHRQHRTLKQRIEEFYGQAWETVLKESSYKYEEMTW